MARATLKAWATTGWILILALMLMAEFYDGSLWTAVLPSVLLWEFAGILVPGRGDLGTDNIRHFIAMERWRAFLAVGVVLWVCYRFAHVNIQFGDAPDFGRTALAAGAAAWLIPHFLRKDGQWVWIDPTSTD